MANHVAVGVVDDDEVILFGAYSVHEADSHLIRAHLGLQVVGLHFRRGHEYAVFAGKGLFAASVEEEGDVGVLLGLGDVQLLQAVRREVFGEGVADDLLGEEDMHALERIVIRRHAVVAQPLDRGHALDRVLCEGNGDFAGAVVAVVEEYDDVPGEDASVYGAVYYRGEELVGHPVFVRVGHSLDHIVSLQPLAASQHVVCELDALPAVVAVHGIEASYNGGDCAGGGRAMLLQVAQEARAALGVGVAAVSETVYVEFVDAVVLGNVAEGEYMSERRVYAAG